MKTLDLGKSRFLNLLFKPSGLVMGSKTRERIFDPNRTLRGAEVQPGQTLLEVGCGTGFFTIPAARLVGDQGHLIAMDVTSGFLEQTSTKVQEAGLENVRIARRDALETGLETASIDKALLLGVIPFPLLPLKRLLPEMHRVLKPGGTMAVWLYPPLVHFWVPWAIVRSRLFAATGKRNGVRNYVRR